ncbi:wax ester/triacylglycerol synthase domain-containing protein [Saccharopolyspora spinosporotrichia]
MTSPPRRLLLLSATIGEGHNATARAVEEAARRAWPGCEVSWLDVLEQMGSWVPASFNWIYAANVESTPWLYDWFYRALWRWRWFADGSRRFVGSWSGRRLRRRIAEHRPDLIVSTYPLGTAGLDWLRRRGELDVPLAAVVSDFCPHPFWVYSRIDAHFVMSEVSLRELHRAEPEAVGEVCAPPVVAAFRPADRTAARSRFGLPEQGVTVLVSCGSLGFGSVERAVDASLAVEGVGRVVVVCARNEALHQRCARRAERDRRLVPLGWTDDMPALIAAADVVVSNAGGATALEALACGRTLVMFEPIAGHGRANAELMAEAGLAELCPRSSDLTGLLRTLTTDPAELPRRERTALEHSRIADFTEQVAALARLRRQPATETMRAQDAFFVHATTPRTPQQAGAVLRLDGGTRSTQEWREHLRELVQHRAPGLPLLTRRMVSRGHRRPRWRHVEALDPAEHVRCRELHSGTPREWHQSRHAFFGTPVRADGPPWELLLLRDARTNRTELLAKAHHALGDGVAITSALLRLLTDDETRAPEQPADRPRARRPRAGVLLRGLAHLASAGFAPSTGIDGRSTAGRAFAWREVPAADVRARARAHGTSTTAVLLAVVAEALHHLLDDRTGTTPGRRFRIMVPRTARLRDGVGVDEPGNHTRTLVIDLPIGPMHPAQRVTEVAERMARAEEGEQPAAAGAVLAALGLLPAPVHRWAVRHVYHRRFFGAVISVLPGRRRPVRIGGARLTTVFPVLSLAEGSASRWACSAGATRPVSASRPTPRCCRTPPPSPTGCCTPSTRWKHRRSESHRCGVGDRGWSWTGAPRW